MTMIHVWASTTEEDAAGGKHDRQLRVSTPAQRRRRATNQYPPTAVSNCFWPLINDCWHLALMTQPPVLPYKMKSKKSGFQGSSGLSKAVRMSSASSTF